VTSTASSPSMLRWDFTSWARSRGASVLVTRRLPILAVLGLQSLLSLRLVNTAFQDEALYIYAGHRQISHLVHGMPLYDNYSTYFSGAPGLYPIVAGWLDGLGGLALVRSFSLACMLAATLTVYWLTNRWFGAGGIYAAALLAVAGPVVFLGHLATFDAPALALLAAAVALATQSARRSWWALIGIAPVLVLAVYTKYAAALFVPSVLALLAVETRRRHGWWAVAARVSIVAAVTATSTLAVLWLSSDALRRGIVATTLQREVLQGTSRVELARTVAEYAGLPLILAGAGLVLVSRRRPILALLLLMTGVLAPINHLRLGEATSLHKHLAFGFVFLAPLAAVAVGRLLGGTTKWSGPQLLAGLALIAAVFYSGLGQAQQLYATWPDSHDLVHLLRTQVRPITGRYLVEEPEVPRYYLRRLVEPYQWSSTYWFQYKKDGRLLTGVDAYRAAIADRHFDLIVLRYGPTAALDTQIDGPLRAQKGYELIGRLPTRTAFGTGYYWVWRRR
jgi:4-amino-4-deoxy-L-arabinose transferase-like glycosyltransferase